MLRRGPVGPERASLAVVPDWEQTDSRISGIRFRERDVPRVLLVRVTDEEKLGLDSVPVQVLRTAHPLQACERARVVRPLVIVAGEKIRPADIALLWGVAEEIHAVVVELAAPLSREQLPAVVRQSMLMAAQSRSTGT